MILTGFQVITAVVMESSVSWDITPCSLLRVSRCFAGSKKPAWTVCFFQFLAWLTLQSWRWWRQRVPPKYQLSFSRLHSFVSQKIQPFSMILACRLLSVQFIILLMKDSKNCCLLNLTTYKICCDAYIWYEFYVILSRPKIRGGAFE
jgi:hypothetical protein